MYDRYYLEYLVPGHSTTPPSDPSNAIRETPPRLDVIGEPAIVPSMILTDEVSATSNEATIICWFLESSSVLFTDDGTLLVTEMSVYVRGRIGR